MNLTRMGEELPLVGFKVGQIDRSLGSRDPLNTSRVIIDLYLKVSTSYINFELTGGYKTYTLTFDVNLRVNLFLSFPCAISDVRRRVCRTTCPRLDNSVLRDGTVT